LTKEQLLLELLKRKINVVKTAKRDELIRELELAITNNIEIIQGKENVYKKFKKKASDLIFLFYSKILLMPLKKKVLLKKKKMQILYSK
jgi:hypothetical protein